MRSRVVAVVAVLLTAIAAMFLNPTTRTTALPNLDPTLLVPVEPGARAFAINSSSTINLLTTATGATYDGVWFSSDRFASCPNDLFIDLPPGAEPQAPTLSIFFGQLSFCPTYAYEGEVEPGIMRFASGQVNPVFTNYQRATFKFEGFANPSASGTSEIRMTESLSLPWISLPVTFTDPQPFASLTVAVSDPTPGAQNVTYDFLVTPSLTGSVYGGGTVTIQMPDGSAITAPTLDPASEQPTGVYAQRAVLQSVTGSTSTYVFAANSGLLGCTNCGILAFALRAVGVTNPVAPGTYEVKMWTSSDSVPTSASIVIGSDGTSTTTTAAPTTTTAAPTATSLGNVSLALSKTKRWATPVTYAVTGTLSATGGLAATSGRVFITVPSETYVPSDVLPAVFDVATGQRATRLTLVGQSGTTYEYRVQRALAAGGTYRFEFRQFANNGARSQQTLAVWTSADTGPIALPYTLTKRG